MTLVTFAWLMRSPTKVETSTEPDMLAFLRISCLRNGKAAAGGSSGTVTVYCRRLSGTVTVYDCRRLSGTVTVYDCRRLGMFTTRDPTPVTDRYSPKMNTDDTKARNMRSPV